MGVWDITTPAGTDPRSQGDDRIRELKTALQEALRGGFGVDEGDEAIFPGNSPTTEPKFRYRGLKGTYAARPAAGQYGLYFDTERNQICRDNGSTWDDVGTHIPGNTQMLFVQPSVPVGWTKIISNNGRIIRVTGGLNGGDEGGSYDVANSIDLAHNHTVNAHTHDLGNHTHSTPAHEHILHHSVSAGLIVTGTGGEIVSSDSDGAQMGIMGSASGSSRHIKNKTQNSGGGTSGTPSDNSTGAAAPGTSSNLGSISLAYVNVVVGSKN